MTKIVLTGPRLSDAAMTHAAAAGAVVVPAKGVLTPEEICALVAAEQPDAVIVRVGKFTREAVAASKRLKVIAKHGVGFDGIDVAAATARGVPVTITAAANAQSVAEHALALMLATARRLPRLDASLRAGKWEKLSAQGLELYGKTLGIVGAGAIGLRLAKLVRSFDMEVLTFDPYAGAEALDQVKAVSSLEELLAKSDVVSLHCPLTDANRGLIGSREFALMRPNAILINTARGELVDVVALEDALVRGAIYGAGLDTFPVEPAPATSPLWSLPNIVVTPHVGASTQEAKDRVGMMAVQQVLEYLGTGAISEGVIVNPEYRDRISSPAA